MTTKGKISGMERVIQRLHAEMIKIEGRTLKGLIEFAILIRRGMDCTPPLIPVYIGNLRQSWFTVSAKGDESQDKPSFKGKNSNRLQVNHSKVISEAKALAIAASVKGPVLIIGFSANYATFVHEMIGSQEKRISWKRPGSGAKFMQASMRRNMKEGLVTIGKNAKIR